MRISAELLCVIHEAMRTDGKLKGIEINDLMNCKCNGYFRFKFNEFQLTVREINNDFYVAHVSDQEVNKAVSFA